MQLLELFIGSQFLQKTFPTTSFPTSILQFLLLFWQIDQFCCGHNAFSWETNKQGAQHSSDLGCAAPIKAKQMEPRITPILNLIKNSIYFHPILLIWLFHLIELFQSNFWIEANGTFDSYSDSTILNLIEHFYSIPPLILDLIEQFHSICSLICLLHHILIWLNSSIQNIKQKRIQLPQAIVKR